MHFKIFCRSFFNVSTFFNFSPYFPWFLNDFSHPFPEIFHVPHFPQIFAKSSTFFPHFPTFSLHFPTFSRISRSFSWLNGPVLRPVVGLLSPWCCPSAPWRSSCWVLWTAARSAWIWQRMFRASERWPIGTRNRTTTLGFWKMIV